LAPATKDSTKSLQKRNDISGLRGVSSPRKCTWNPPPAGRIENTPNARPSGRAAVVAEHQESQMIPETQVHVIARQMIEKHGFEAIAQAAQNAVACEAKGDTEEAKEWRHIEAAMKLMRGPNQT
jgi:hypothetical protein